MRVSEIARRYAQAAYSLAGESKNQEAFFDQIRELDKIFTQDKDIIAFLKTPMIKAEQRVAALSAALKNANIAPELNNFVMVLAKKGRLSLFSEIVQAFEQQIDSANGVARGTVRSATVLGPNERQQIETIVEKQLKKKVIMTYKVDPGVIGGLIADVGSFTFDDSLASHLRRMNEELSRQGRANDVASETR